jgi:BirA family biotin operon repressor/biotin-[acetyl-CoA-carboxylase] ligase
LRDRLDNLKAELDRHVENLVIFDVVDSTHALARQIIAEMDEESQRLGATLILADRQEKGEGRGDRRWESPKGGLYMSWLRSGVTAEIIIQLPMLAAAAAHDAIAKIGVSDLRIKWPNDILVGGRKLAGIVVFARHGDTSWVTVGLGVNIEAAPILEGSDGLPATSVVELLGQGDTGAWRHELAHTFISQLDRSMGEPQPAIDRWRELLIQQPGDTVNVRLASGAVVSGSLVEVSPEGFLKIKEDGKERIITGGDIIER